MKPVEATLTFQRVVKENGEPKVDEYDRMVYDSVEVFGVLADVVILSDKAEDKENEDAYALFFEHKSDHYVPSVEKLSDIKVSDKEMMRYLKSHY